MLFALILGNIFDWPNIALLKTPYVNIFLVKEKIVFDIPCILAFLRLGGSLLRRKITIYQFFDAFTPDSSYE